MRGWGALALAVAAFVGARVLALTELVYLGALVSCVIVLGWMSLWLVHRYRPAHRTFSPDVTAVGTESTVTVHVQARGSLAGTMALWQDQLPAGVEADGHRGRATGLLGSAAAQDEVRVSYRLRAERRGIRSIGPFSIVVTDPFGIARRRVRLGGSDEVVVTPAIVALPALGDFAGEAGGSLHTATHQLGEGADNLIPRPYLAGDSMRRINWRASAHHLELMVRQEEQESTPEATVVLDRSAHRWAPAARIEPGGDPAFETAVTAVASAAARLAREGYDVTVVDADGAALAPLVAADDHAAVEELALGLATVLAVDTDHLSHLPRLFAGTVAGPVVVVSGRLLPHEADMIASLAPRSALPVLLAIADHPEGDAPFAQTLGRAAQAGWRASALAPGGDIAQAWRETTNRGTTHVGL